ncbi:MAG: MGDG synthase family glycosyltransferase [Acidimicrobiia bacterium]
MSASMGAGHDGAARELQRRLVAQGHDVRIVDFLHCCPFGIGWFIRVTYLMQLKVAPWSYELTYRLWYKLPSTWSFIVRLDTFVAGRRLRKAITETDADVVVSTYPLSSLVLGNMRKKRWLKVPVMTFLTDFAVHPLWVHPHVDVHLATSPFAAATARRRGGDDARAPGPLVAEHFQPAEDAARRSVREELGLDAHARAVLVVAGSWGVGDIPGTVAAIAAAGDFHPVVVCGRDEKLKAELEARGAGTILGWRDDMPRLMAACDVMVENAGGLTANEAFAVGLPVVTFLPIAGHGKDNAEGMAELGVTRYARDAGELRDALTELCTPSASRQEQIARAHDLFDADPAEDVVETAGLRTERGIERPIQMPKAPHRVRVAAGSLLALYGLLTLGAQGVAALGVGVAAAPKAAHHRVFLGVRLTADELASPAVRARLDRMNATAIIDGVTARTAGRQPMEALLAHSVDVGNGGWGQSRAFRPLRAQADVLHTTDVITRSAPVKVREFVPGRRFDAFDQLFARRRGERLVDPDRVVRPEALPRDVRDRAVYVIDGRNRSAAQVDQALASFEQELHARGLTVGPLSELR